jgi:hypothetical protein
MSGYRLGTAVWRLMWVTAWCDIGLAVATGATAPAWWRL